MLQFSVNKCVFSRRLKRSFPRFVSFKPSGWEFKSDEAATENASGPSVMSRHRGTTKRRWVAVENAAVLRRRTLVNRYLRGTEVIGRASNCTLWRKVCMKSFRHIEPMKFWVQEPQQTSIVLVSTGDHTSSSIQYPLQLVSDHFLRTCQQNVAIVDTPAYECVDQCCGRVSVQWAPDASELP